MIKIETYSATGRKLTPTSLPKQYEESINMALLAQALHVYEDRKHPGSSKVKTRGEIKASTRKIYRQKGTGRARHGARSAPIFVGGGVAHGPKGVKRTLVLSRKLARKALNVSLSLKAKKGYVFIVDGVSKLKKTREASNLIGKILKSRKEIKNNVKLTIALSEKGKGAVLAFRNLEDVRIVPFRNLNAYQVYYGGILLIDRDAFAKKSVSKKDKIDSKKSVKDKNVKKSNVSKLTRPSK